MWLWLSTGCAECWGGDDPGLTRLVGTYPDQDTAQRAVYDSHEPTRRWKEERGQTYRERPWHPHPGGGVAQVASDGQDWVVSLEDFLAGAGPEE